ncbi:polymeric immunoglobulin receptor-like isoform X2 [Engraulis encrasicolus]|uniref:polymeric immunoglobulin receptor-like isoform X2 n=1 Tax=Engraulis encrasicolus TaxID=184585 RepID=UPI002FD01D26
MKALFVKTLFFILNLSNHSGVCSAEPVLSVSGRVGGSVEIRCPYDAGYETYSKYLCRGACSYGNKDKLVETEEGKSGAVKVRFSLHDNTTSRIFTVSITGLTAKDAGKYRCGIKTGFAFKDIYIEVNLGITPPVITAPLTSESDRATSPPPATPPPTPTAPPSTPTAPPLPPQVNVGVLAGDVVGYCGGGVSIRCEYDTQYGQRPKYFCQGEQAACRELIRTSTKGKWVSKDRFSLFDNGTHYFIVSISELTTSDSGRYQCGVSVLEGEPVQTEVNLKVKDEVSNCGITMVKTAFVGETLNVTCPYLDVHEHAGKYLCKAFHGQSCNYKVSAQADSTWVHSDKVSVFDDSDKTP